MWMPMGAAFTERALALAMALLPTEEEKAAWRKQVRLGRRGKGWDAIGSTFNPRRAGARDRAYGRAGGC